MSLCNAVALALVLAQPAPPPPPSALPLTAAEDAVVRPMVAKWKEANPFPASPLVVTVEAFPYMPIFEPALRLELLRHGVDATTTEALLASMAARNAQPHAIEGPALKQTTRIRFLDVLLKGMDKRTMDDAALRNLGNVVALAAPGTSGDAGVVFYNVGPQMTNTMFKGAHFAFVRSTATFQRGAAGWTLTHDETRLQSATGPPDPSVPLRVGGDVKGPIVVKRVRPSFPAGTRLVIAEIIVGADGKITNIHFLTPVSPELERLAREALAQWELKPGTLNGKPVTVIWNVTLP